MENLKRFWGFRPLKRHGLILLVVGFVYALVGVHYIISEPSPGRTLALKTVLDIAPIEVWGGIFIFAGSLAVLSSKWPKMTETWGYIVLTGLSSGWSVTYLLGIVFYNSPVANTTQALLWGCLAFMWWAISGLLNPDKTAVTSNAP